MAASILSDLIQTTNPKDGKISFRLVMPGYNNWDNVHVPECSTEVTIDLNAVLAVARKAQRGKSGRAVQGGVSARRIKEGGK